MARIFPFFLNVGKDDYETTPVRHGQQLSMFTTDSNYVYQPQYLVPVLVERLQVFDESLLIRREVAKPVPSCPFVLLPWSRAMTN